MFASRQLESEYPYLILDAWYEKVRETGVILSRARHQAIRGETRRQTTEIILSKPESVRLRISVMQMIVMDPNPAQNKRTRVTVTIPPSDYKAVRRIANDKKVSASSILRDAVEKNTIKIPAASSGVFQNSVSCRSS